MTTAEILYQLQQIDDDVRAKEGRLAEVEAHLGESDELLAARTQLEQAEAKLYELEREQREQELELKTITSKLESEESRLYGGRVTNPKELAGLQKEVRYLRERRADVEDDLLETMMAREETAARVAERRSKLEAIESTWQTEQSALTEERDRLQFELAELRSRREEIVSQVPPRPLSTYEYLRRTKGVAVAPLDNGICTGCRVSLPAAAQKRAERDDLITCSNCSRILVIP